MHPGVGKVVAGRYRLEAPLGAGGMGVVYRATQIDLQRAVAVKVLRSDVVLLPETVERFLREARTAASIQSDHVVQVLDVGHEEDGTPFMVMELLSGEDLGQRLERHGKLEPGEVVPLLLQACEALRVAHARRIMHRDLKPANLFVARRGAQETLKLLDFGISKTVGETDALTQTSAMLGTALYMAPEQLRRARDLDTRVDIWAMGVVLHELLAGRPPFEGDTLAELVTQVLEGRRTPLGELRPELSPGYDAIIARCLATDREARYANVEALAAALQRPETERTTQDLATAAALATERAPNPLTHADHASQTRTLPTSRPPMVPPAPSLVAPAAPTPSVGVQRGERRGNRYGAWVGAFALVLVAAIGTAAIYARRADERKPTRSGAANSAAPAQEPAAVPTDATAAAPVHTTASPYPSAASAAATTQASASPPTTTSTTTPPRPPAKGASTAGGPGYTGAATSAPGNPFDKLRIK